MKKRIALVLVLTAVFLFSLSAHAEREINLSFGSLLASGYTPEAANELIAKAEKGEPLTPFHPVDYEDYNSPAEENGLGNDTVLLYGTIREYIQTGSKSEYIKGFYLEEESGNNWLISCAAKTGGILIGDDYSGKETTVFDALEGKTVEIYGTYLGFSDDYKLPVVDITNYGGLYYVEDDRFILTQHAEYWMQRDGIFDIYKLVGAKRYTKSAERM